MTRGTGTATGAIGMIFFVWFIFILSVIPAWITHIIWIVSNLGADNVVAILLFGLFALFIAPVGVVHGWALWLGGGDWIKPVFTETVSFILNLGVVA